ncbi:peptide-binding protein [Nibribacter koreensis]|uniref:Peptide-binding protein n=1 Tax=Nibribacter koreensis TaxID=1084519 RepID=A0ABP8FBF3_9BACT
MAANLPLVTIKDSLSYFAYQIRPEARWDDGKPVTAQDVAFSLKLLNSPLLDNERWRAQYHFIKDIVLSNKNPLAFTIICSGYTPEMNLLTGDFFVLPAHRYDPQAKITQIPFGLFKIRYDSLANSPAIKELSSTVQSPSMAKDTAWVRGSGPYKLMAWSGGQQVTLSKKKNWWGTTLEKSSPSFRNNPSTLQFQIIEDNAAAVIALKARQLDVMDNIPLPSFLEMQRNKSFKQDFSLHTAPTFDLVFLGINGSSPLLNDKLTRQALSHLVNIPQLIKTIQGGYATATVGLVHPEEKQFYNSTLPPIDHNPAKTQDLLQKAGWKKSSEGWVKSKGKSKTVLALTLMYRAGNSEFESIALLFQQNAKAMGIPVSLQAIESSQISQRLQDGTFDLYLRTFVGNPFSYNLLPLLHTSSIGEGGGNVTRFGNAETDQLLERISIESNQNTKATLLKQLQEKMQEERNLVFLFFQQNKLAVSKKVDSVIISSLKPGYDLPKFVLKK